MKIHELLEWGSGPGPGDEATWGPPTGHPNDPRTPEYNPQAFDDHVVVDSVYYDANTQEHPIQITVDVEAEADDGIRGMEWAIGSFNPLSVKVNGKTIPWDQFIQSIPQDDNETFFDTKKYGGEWREMLSGAMPRPDDPDSDDGYYEDRDR